MVCSDGLDSNSSLPALIEEALASPNDSLLEGLHTYFKTLLSGSFLSGKAFELLYNSKS